MGQSAETRVAPSYMNYADFSGMTAAVNSGQVKIETAVDLVSLLRSVFAENIQDNDAAADGLRRQQALLQEFETRATWNVQAYDKTKKPVPSAVFWPDPSDEKRGGDLYETLPYVVNHGIVDINTPIGSAGSCFAVEIARILMDRGFNYGAKEKAIDRETGVRYNGALSENDPPQFSANWGILFNSPSFRQIAEKAFGKRKFPRILVDTGAQPPQFMDPYRENVDFPSVSAYERDYARHVAACRAAFTECEVFVITLGLNECWEFVYDGSVMSRNPQGADIAGLIRHRRLTVSENVAEIQRFIDLIREHNPKLKLIISVSPVPFLATAMAEQEHVVAANGHSKAVLRVAAHELSQRNEGIYYFPSYELVTMCCRDPWDIDQRHVSRTAVARVMQLFDAMFLKK